MNEEQFNKGLKEFKQIKLSEAEKSSMLKGIFSAPTPSPYLRHTWLFMAVQNSSTLVWDQVMKIWLVVTKVVDEIEAELLDDSD